MTPAQPTLTNLANRIEQLEEKLERYATDQTACIEALEKWRVGHEEKSQRIIETSADILAMVEAMRWVNTTRYVLLWIVGASATVITSWQWIEPVLVNFFSHRGP